VRDAEGQPLGTHVLQPMEDPATVARSILRAKKRPEPFWNPLLYA
jgi:hypothetical protein